MIKVTVGDAFKNFEISDFFEMPNEVVSASWTESSATIALDENNYMELTGSFEGEKSGKSFNKLLGHTTEITSMTKVIDGEVYMEVKGLSIGDKELNSLSDYQKYLTKAAYDVTGNDAGNRLEAGSGKDGLDGGKGNDDIIGNGGDDELTGGAGKDDFIYHKGDGTDMITDFAAAGKQNDTIDLSEYGEKLKFTRDIDLVRDGKDVVIEIGNSDEIILDNVLAHFKFKEITGADFDF